MHNQTCFESFLHFGDASEKPGLDENRLADLEIDINGFVSLKLLKKLPLPTEVECETCDNYADLIYERDEYKTVVYAKCPQCGLFKPDMLGLNRWIPDFSPLFIILRREMNCNGEMEEVIPDILWNIGRCALSGQSRDVFVVAGINTWRNSEIEKTLPQGVTPIMIVLGDRPLSEKIGIFSSDRIFSMSSLIKLTAEGLTADISPIKHGFDLLNMLYAPPKRGPGKNAKIGDITMKLLTELRQYMAGIYSAMDYAEKHEKKYDFAGITQKELAEMLGTTPVMVNRAIKQNPLLPGLFECANDPRRAYSYGMRVANGTI